jgi:hypothetical protein
MLDRPARSEGMAFVIQLAAGVGGDGASLQGWVEHLASGTEAPFGSADELLAFIRRLAGTGR